MVSVCRVVGTNPGDLSRRQTIETEPIIGKDFEMKEPFNGNINTINTIEEMNNRLPIESTNNGSNSSNKNSASSTKKAIFGMLGLAVVGAFAYGAYTLFAKHLESQNENHNGGDSHKKST